MRLLILICLILTPLLFCNGQINSVKPHNKIDAIQNAADIDKLVDSIDKKRFEMFIVNESLKFKDYRGKDDKDCNDLAQFVKAEPWVKADFDKDGTTDLLVLGKDRDHVVILNNGGNHFVVKSLARGFFPGCTIPTVKKQNEETTIEYHSLNRGDGTVAERLKTIPLIFKFGGFVEVNDKSKTYNIEKINYVTSGCFGSCPIFELTLGSDRKAFYKSIQFNNLNPGSYKGTVEAIDYDNLVRLLNYIDFPKLENRYSVNWTDDQTSVLTVTYDNGKTKTISDYGLIGTFGLSQVYSVLFSMRYSQKWR